MVLPALGEGASLNGNLPFLADSPWNADVTTWPLHPDSSMLVAILSSDFEEMLTTVPLHPEFGQGLYNGATIGLPYIVVSETQPLVPVVAVAYPDESDPGPMPIPPNAPIEGTGGSNEVYDRHVIVIQRDPTKPNGLGFLYELFNAFKITDGGGAVIRWECDNAAIWDLNGPGWGTRTLGWTSADAAGLPIFPGLVRYDEVASGVVNHAFRFTAGWTRREFVRPATHYASWFTADNPPPGTGPLAGIPAADRHLHLPPMGLRVRLKASYVINPAWPAHVKTILAALKKHGMILADNGGGGFITGAPSESWNNDNNAYLGEVPVNNFEAIVQPVGLPGTPSMPSPVTLIKRGGGSTRLTAGDFDANMIEIEDWTAAAQAEIVIAAGSAGSAKRFIDLRDFSGIDWTGANDATTDVNNALLQAYTAGYAVSIPGGILRVSTLRWPTRTEIFGMGIPHTKIITDGSNDPIIKSKNLFTGDAHAGNMQGYCAIHDLQIIGSNDQALNNQHGIVFRDFFSQIHNVQLVGCGGNAIKFTEVNDASVRTGVGVNNQIRDCAIYENRGIQALVLGDSASTKMTDGLLENLYVNSARTGANTGYTQIYVGNAAGWRIRNIHTYSYHPTASPLVNPLTSMHLVKSWHTQLRDIYLEEWENSGLYLEGGGLTMIDGITCICQTASSGGGGSALYIDGSGTYGNPVVHLQGLGLTKSAGTQTVYPITVDHNARLNLAAPVSVEGSRIADFLPNRKLNGGLIYTPADLGGTWNSV